MDKKVTSPLGPRPYLGRPSRNSRLYKQLDWFCRLPEYEGSAPQELVASLVDELYKLKRASIKTTVT